MAAVESSELLSTLSRFEAIANNPEAYLNPSSNLPKDTAHIVKDLFDFAKRDELHGSRSVTTCPLQELLVENFDDEQIWQEIELQSEPLLLNLARDIRSLKNKKDKLSVLYPNVSFAKKSDEQSKGKVSLDNQLCSQEHEVNGDESVESEHGFSSSEEKEDIAEESDTTGEDLNNETERSTKKPKQKSVVDDKFFKLADMAEFLDKEDRRYEQAQAGKNPALENSENEDDDDDESVDYFAQIDSDEGEDDDGDDWGNALDTTAKLMGRYILYS